MAAIETAIGLPPSPESMAYLRWFDRAVDHVYGRCVFTRTGTTYYFSTSGSDAANGTSPATPKQTLSAADGLVGAGVTLLFKRGDVWRELQTLTLDAVGCMVGCWGDPGDDPPLLSAFLIEIDSGESWTADGDAYYIDIANVTSNPGSDTSIGWLRQASVAERLNPYRYRSSVATCKATPYSWTWDGSNSRIYVNTGDGTDPGDYDWECTPGDATLPGVVLDADQVLVQDIDAHGWGCSISNPSDNQDYGIKSAAHTAEVVMVRRCREYYSGRHQLSVLADGLTGGTTLFQDCRAGHSLDTGAGCNTFNAYSSQGELEACWDRCVAEFGRLPDESQAINADNNNDCFYGHTGSSTYKTGLFIVRDCETLDPTKVGRGTRGVPLPRQDTSMVRGTAGSWSTYGVHILGHKCDYQGTLAATSRGLMTQNTHYVNCHWSFDGVGNNAIWQGTASTRNGATINCVIVRREPATTYSCNGVLTGTRGQAKAIGCLVIVESNASEVFRLHYGGVAGSAPDAPAVANTLFVCRVAQSPLLTALPEAYPGHYNDGVNARGNGYAGNWRSTNNGVTGNGYNQDPEALVVAFDDVPSEFTQFLPESSPLVGAGVTTFLGLTLEYDHYGRPRPAVPAIGPFDVRVERQVVSIVQTEASAVVRSPVRPVVAS